MKKLLRSPVPRAQSLLTIDCLSIKACLEKGQVAADSDRDLGYAPALPGIPTYLLKYSIAKPKFVTVYTYL